MNSTLLTEEKISVNIPTTSKPRIVIVGGGFAGIGRRERVRLQAAGVIGARGCGLC